MLDVQPNGHVSIWSMGDGTAVCSVKGSDGAVVTVMLKSGALDVKLLYQGHEWSQTFVYRGQGGPSIEHMPMPKPVDDGGNDGGLRQSATGKPTGRRTQKWTLGRATGT